MSYYEHWTAAERKMVRLLEIDSPSRITHSRRVGATSSLGSMILAPLISLNRTVGATEFLPWLRISHLFGGRLRDMCKNNIWK